MNCTLSKVRNTKRLNELYTAEKRYNKDIKGAVHFIILGHSQLHQDQQSCSKSKNNVNNKLYKIIEHKWYFSHKLI